MISKPRISAPAFRLLIAAGAALGVIAIFNIFVAYVSRNSVPRQLIRRMDSAALITHLALGNSLIVAGFDPKEFDADLPASGANSFNAGIGGTTNIEHLVILQRALQRHPKVGVVIYGFIDFELTDPPDASFFGNRAIDYYVAPDTVVQFLDMTPRELISFEVGRRLPMVVDRGAIWARIEMMRRTMSQIGMPEVGTNEFGQVRDFASLEARDPAQFEAKCTTALSDAKGLAPAIREIIGQSRAVGAQVVIVEMPVTDYHRRSFYSQQSWSLYRSYVRGLVEKAGGTYLISSEWITDPSLFEDNVHLSKAGAKVFSRRLATAIQAPLALAATSPR